MAPMSVADALTTVVLPALEALTEPYEITSAAVSVREHGEVWATIDFAGEGPFTTMIWAPPGDSFWGLGKFASDLQDHISESRHAWGELRPYPPEWDR